MHGAHRPTDAPCHPTRKANQPIPVCRRSTARSTQPLSGETLPSSVYVSDNPEFIFLSKTNATLIVPLSESDTPCRTAFYTGARLADDLPNATPVAQHHINWFAVDFIDGQLIGKHRSASI